MRENKEMTLTRDRIKSDLATPNQQVAIKNKLST